MSAIIFDIETAGLDADLQLQKFEPKFKLDGRIKDPAKLELDRQEKEQEWLERAPLEASRGKVLVIGVIIDGEPSVWEGVEGELLVKFWHLWDRTPSGSWVGHNIKGFDVPFLIRRSFVNGIFVPPDIMDGRYLNRRFVDTMQLWAAGEYGCMISLDNLARALGVGKKVECGKDFSARYHADRESALQYVRHDILLTLACARIMGVA